MAVCVYVWPILSFRARKFISLQILEEDSYEKDVLFYLEIDEPKQLGGKFEMFHYLNSPKLVSTPYRIVETHKPTQSYRFLLYVRT